jgi:hypothetical protein
VHTNREVLFANEAFAIGMLQGVSGGAVVAALAQAESLVKWAGRTSFLLFITAATLALGLAVLAAYWRHQYKMWDVKNRSAKANFYLHALRSHRRSALYPFRSWAVHSISVALCPKATP